MWLNLANGRFSELLEVVVITLSRIFSQISQKCLVLAKNFHYIFIGLPVLWSGRKKVTKSDQIWGIQKNKTLQSV